MRFIASGCLAQGFAPSWVSCPIAPARRRFAIAIANTVHRRVFALQHRRVRRKFAFGRSSGIALAERGRVRNARRRRTGVTTTLDQKGSSMFPANRSTVRHFALLTASAAAAWALSSQAAAQATYTVVDLAPNTC